MSASPDQRPLSPHLQIYRWRISMALSILHRATGVILSLGTVFLVFWLYAAATNSHAMWLIEWVFESLWGQAALMLWAAAVFLHLLNGIRHLFWDAGLGFEKHQFTLSGWVVVAGAIALTLMTWLAAVAGGNG